MSVARHIFGVVPSMHLAICILVAAISGVLFVKVSTQLASAQNQDVPLGMYDPGLSFAEASSVAIHHVFVGWYWFDPVEFRSEAAYAIARHRQLMVTIEPWLRPSEKDAGDGRMLREIVTGEYNLEIDKVCEEIGRLNLLVFVRWGHEMDDQPGRYPWTGGTPVEFRAAFIHFVDRCARLAPKAKFGWSVKGEAGMAEFYPGDRYVDFIGIAVFGVQAWDIAHFGRARPFIERMAEQYERVRFLRKPVMLAETGVSGDPAYRAEWLRSMLRRDQRYPLMAVIYFNEREPWPWPDPIGKPDWRISEEILAPRSP